MLTKLYNKSFRFHSSDNPSSIDSSTDTIDIVPVETLPFHTYIYSYLYQNNQNRHIALMTDHEHTSVDAGQNWVFYVEDVVNFQWTNGENSIRYCMIDPTKGDIREYWLVHIVIPMFLSMQKSYYFIHAGSVLIEDKLVAFIAPSFGGKSTLTDYFLRQGHTMVTDDKLPTYESGGRYFGVPAHPYHRPYRKPEDLGLISPNFADEPREISAIYVLDKREPDEEIIIHPLKGIEKFSRLHEGAEMNFSFMNREYVSYLSKLANGVKVYNITIPHDLNRLDEVYQSIKGHVLGVGDSVSK